MITELFNQVGNAITGFVGCLGNSLEGVVDIFWVQPETGTGHFTTVGVLLLVAMGVGLVYFAYRTIRGLIRHA